MAKRIFGLFLALCLVVGLLPMIALAAEEEEKPVIPAEITVTTGDIYNPIVWAPEMSQGMAPAYAKTTAEGSLVLEGASESDYNLKAEWPAGGKPTLTLNNATLANNNRQIDKTETELNNTGASIYCPETIDLGGTEDFVVVIKGTNTILGRHDEKPQTTAAYRSPAGIFSDSTGTLTITADSKADSLLIDNYSGILIEKYCNALTIENVTIKGIMHNTKLPDKSTNAQFGIVLKPNGADNNDKMNFTVRNAVLDIEDAGKYYGNNLFYMGNYKGADMEACTGDILFQNSTIRLYRANTTGSTGNGSEVMCFGSGSTLTIDRCDVLIYGRHRTMNYWPTMTNVDVVTAGDMVLPAGTKVNSSTLPKLELTHQCGTTGSGDCTKAQVCDVCGKTLVAAQSAHVAAADDGDCTTAVMCANEGCKVVMVEAKAAHAPQADDGDCTTAITCGNAGCTQVTTPAAAHHTSPAGRTDCNTPANCTVCNKALVVGEHMGGTATCKDKAVCIVCNQAYGELGAHAGGTATCKDKAVCDTCKQPYGELSAVHTPEADDGNCETAVKCSVCGGEAVAAKKHVYSSDTDKSCDNEGCTYTRTLTTNPNSGDISVLLTAAVALSSAVGFAGVTVLRKKEK